MWTACHQNSIFVIKKNLFPVMELSIKNEILDFILLCLFKTDPFLIVLTQLGTLRFFAKAEQHNSFEFF